jgi:hypothetical protein
LTFIRNHAEAVVACDFFAVVTVTFRTLYVFVIMEVGTRRILHHNVAVPLANLIGLRIRTLNEDRGRHACGGRVPRQRSTCLIFAINDG